MDTAKPKEKIIQPEISRAGPEIAPPEIKETAPVLEKEKAPRLGGAELPPAPAAPPWPTPPTAPPPPQAKEADFIKVEKILEENLAQAYQSMEPELQSQFKKEGERIASLVWQMIKTAKIQVKEILKMIVHWLKMIPGVNRYFLEQESKIKTDKIIAIAKRKE